jgi:multiple sugar transport system permease protein
MRRPNAPHGRQRKWPVYVVGLPIALLMLAPFLYMVATALLGEGDTLRRPHPQTFAAALAAAPFARFFLNSAILSVAAALGQVVTSTTAAYAFARLRFPGRDRLFVLYLAALMIPAVLLIVPRFLLISALGWVDTYQGLISTELVSVSGIFLLRQFFLAIPRDLEDAARLEGAGEWTVFRRVVLPLSGPAVGTLGVLALADQWKSFFWPLVATSSPDMQVLEVGIARLHGAYDLNWPYQMAAATTAVIPMVVLYFIAQKYFLRGIELTGPQ